MNRKTATTETTARNTAGASLDLRIRLSDDGGPLFRALMQLGNAHVRGERVRQLMYLGFIRELELSVRSADSLVAPLPSRTTAVQVSAQLTRPSDLEASGASVGTKFDSGDLAAVFG